MINRSISARLVLLTVLIVAIAQVGSAYAETQKLVDSTVVVPNLGYYTITREIVIDDMENVRIEGTITVSDGSINVYIMESAGYEAFQKNAQTDLALYRADNVRSHSLSVPIPQSGTYHIILDNPDLLTSKTVQVQLQLSFERPSQRLMGYAVLAVVGITILVGIVLVVRRMRKKSQPTTQVIPSAASAAPLAPKYCVHCGALMHQMARTCPACGREQRP